MTQATELALAGLDTLGEWSDRLALWASPERVYIGELLRVVSLQSGDRLLDLGCGSGDLLAAAASREPGAILFGIDPDEDALELASHKIAGTIHAAELHQGVAERLPFDDEDFDVVCAARLLGALAPKARSAALAEAWRVLRPGGRLLVADWAEEPGVLEALATLPWRLAWRLAASVLAPGDAGAPTVTESIAIARFHPAEPRARFLTVAGTLDLLEAFKPLGA